MLPRGARVQKSRDFRAIYRKRCTFSSTRFVLHIGKVSEYKYSSWRFGFVISKKVAKKSHERNLLKRRLREICRTSIIPSLDPAVRADILIVARGGASGIKFDVLVDEVNQLCRKAGLLIA